MKTISREEAIKIISAMVRAKGSQVKAAKELDISPAYLGDIIGGRRMISDSVARKLGYKRVVLYVKEEGVK